MGLEWREFVKQEFIKTDNDFTKKLPINSINLATFGLVSEATTFVLVRYDGGIHLRPHRGGLPELRKDLKKSSRPGGGFNVDKAMKTLNQFAEEWEKEIKESNNWKKMVKIAEKEGNIIDKEDFDEKMEGSSSSLASKLKNLFKF